ncbi:MAG: GntR family transcriptional regulator [Desulfovibrio sp.]|jgi:DNA-binding GntR family transcriptional regulator|nr:GntR family transcriptional regulator [Desulfovibrio sp.]
MDRDKQALKTYSAQISDHIKKALLKGELKPGDKINEVRLAAALSISRAPVREALQLLVNNGLVVSVPQRGKFIKKLSAKEIQDGYHIGGVLEGAAVAMSVESFDDGDFARLNSLLRSMGELRKTSVGYGEQLADLDVAFHDALLARASNRLMVEQARAMCQRRSKFLLFNLWPGAFTPDEVVERHKRVLDAVNARSRRVIEETLREHYIELGARMAALASPPAETRACAL